MRTVALAALLVVFMAMPVSADWVKLEDFEGGNLNNWTTNTIFDASGSGIVADPGDAGNNVLFVDDPGASTATNVHNIYLGLGDDNIALGDTGTLFGRMRINSHAGANAHLGVSASTAPFEWNSFSAYMTHEAGTGQAWRVRDGGTFYDTDQQPAAQTWINFWVVVDNPNDVYHVYYTTTYGEGAELLSDNMTHSSTDGTFTFRAGTGALAMETLLVRASGDNFDGFYLDDLYIDSSSQNLSNPLGVVPEPGTMLLLGTAALGLIGYVRRKRLG